jgi:hypothetical protein
MTTVAIYHEMLYVGALQTHVFIVELFLCAERALHLSAFASEKDALQSLF